MTRHLRFLLIPVLSISTLLTVPVEVSAQRRAVAAPRARPVYVRAPGYYAYPRFYYPRYYYPAYYYSPWFGPRYSFGFYAGWPYYYGAYPYQYGYPYYWRYDTTGSARLDIAQREALVYVDGYYVGRVDEFDGALQRLHVEAGEHELQVYLEGYRTFRQKVLFTRGHTVKITHVLQPLGPGEAPDPRPTPDPNAAARRGPDRMQRYDAPPYRPGEQSEFGTLSLKINPADAEVLVDGESWDRPEAESRFSIDLAEGPHRVEVRKEGFRPYVRTIEVRRGRTITLNVSLSAGGSDADSGDAR